MRVKEVGDILRGKVVHKHRGALRHRQHGIPLDLGIRRENTLRQPRHYALGKIEILFRKAINSSHFTSRQPFRAGQGRGGKGGGFLTSRFTPSLGVVSFTGDPSSPVAAFEASLFRGGMAFGVEIWAVGDCLLWTGCSGVRAEVLLAF